MAKFLDITGLQMLWAKIKGMLSKYISANASSTSFHGYPSSGSDSSKFSEFVSKEGAAMINLTSGANRVFAASSRYIQILKGSQSVALYGDHTEIKGKVNFTSDDVNFKMSTKSANDIQLDIDGLPSSVKGIEVKKLFNIDNFYSLLLIKIHSTNSTHTYNLVDLNASKLVAAFPPLSANMGETFGGVTTFTTCVLLPLAKSYAGSHYMGIELVL